MSTTKIIQINQISSTWSGVIENILVGTAQFAIRHLDNKGLNCGSGVDYVDSNVVLNVLADIESLLKMKSYHLIMNHKQYAKPVIRKY